MGGLRVAVVLSVSAVLSLAGCGGGRFDAQSDNLVGVSATPTLPGDISAPSNSNDSTDTDLLGATDVPPEDGVETDVLNDPAVANVDPSEDSAPPEPGAEQGQPATPAVPPTDTPTDDSPVDNGEATHDQDGGADSAKDAGPVSSEQDAGCSDCSEQESDTDECPEWPEQSERGACGCGFESDAVCSVLEVSLVHRYSFDGDGATAIDSIGSADGTVVGTKLSGDGELRLSGSGDYLNLPAGIISKLETATFEFWLEWHGGDAEQRVFDFGGLSTGFASQRPQSYLYLSPSSSTSTRSGNQPLTVSYSQYGVEAASFLRVDEPLPDDQRVHIALVVDAQNNELRLYLDGELVGNSWLSWSLTQLDDKYNRLGRSLEDYAPDFDGIYDEFRIYDLALTEDELTKSIELGPNATFSQ